AAALLGALPGDVQSPDEANVRGSWSLSERLRQDLLGTLRGQLALLKVEINCQSLALVDSSGPLRFAWLPGTSASDPVREALSRALARELDEAKAHRAGAPLAALGDAPKPAAAGGSEKDKDRIIVRGFPSSWSEQQVKLVFAVFGGVDTVSFAGGSGGKPREACVVLRAGISAERTASQLNSSEVGDGELMERCRISCEFVRAGCISWHEQRRRQQQQ
ncbi:unnamed protein product, partial [Prorocentrum cordatum]